MVRAVNPTMRCPCRKKSETIGYADCCGPYHRGDAVPATAEALMRSRYAAFAAGNGGYLKSTWHTSTRPEGLDLDQAQEWLGLKVKDTQTNGDVATVTFEARSRSGGRTHVLAETSRFVREGGRWFYVAGDVQAWSGVPRRARAVNKTPARAPTA